MDRYIFDIDGTLLHMDWDEEDEFFRDMLDEDTFELFYRYKMDYLYKYEDVFSKYKIKTLSYFYRIRGINLTEELIKKWIYINGNNLTDKLDDSAIEVLEYLKANNKKLSILSNFFSECQIARLKRAGIYDYFDTIVCGDYSIKPNKEGYIMAADDTPLEKCIMIGDHIVKDYEAPIKYGMNAYLVDDEHPLIKVKEIR